MVEEGPRIRSEEIRSATPQEIREMLGLPEDATNGQVVARRWQIYDLRRKVDSGEMSEEEYDHELWESED